MKNLLSPNIFRILVLAVMSILAINTYSQIDYYEIDQTLIGPGSFTIDINNDGELDYTFDILELSTDVYAARVYSLGMAEFLDNSTYGYADALDLGDSIKGYFNTGFGILGTFNDAGQFNGAGNKYLGLKIWEGYSPYIAWIKLNCSFNNDTLNLISCAHNTVSFEIITAGQGDIVQIDQSIYQTSTKINLYPNPTTDYITIKLFSSKEAATIKLFNIQGEEVLQQVFSNNNQISIKHLNKGMYLYVVVQNDFIYRGKLMIN